MLIIPPVKYRPRRRPGRQTEVALPPVLVAAVYVEGTSVTLTFDQAIDGSRIDPSQFKVDDGVYTGDWYLGGGVESVSTTSIRILLDDISGGSAADVELTVWADNGIAAINGGMAWGGVGALALPFPQ